MGKVSAWIKASRLRTLPLAFSTILMGSFVALKHGYFDWPILVLCLVTTLFLQILSNLANDYGDATSGVDGSQRIGPSRTVQAGLISKEEMKWGLIVSSVLSLVAGSLLIYVSFGNFKLQSLVFFVLGLASIVAAIKYTVGKNPYGYAGFGDLFVLIFFGFVGVGGTYYLFAKSLDWTIMLPAATLGLLSVGVLNVNNIRDLESDQSSGKFSIPVRIGRKWAIRYHLLLLGLAMIFPLIFLSTGSFKWTELIFLLSYPLIIQNGRAVAMKKPEELDPYLKKLAISTLVFVVLYGIGVIL